MKPVRAIPIQTLSVGGKFSSRKNSRIVSYESQLELAFLYHLEFSPDVKAYVEQPCKVPSPSGRHYVPDFLVFFNEPLRRPLLVEVKYSSEIRKNSDKLLTKFETLEKYALKKGYDFKVFTEKDLLTPRLKNYKFLYNYLDKPLPENLYATYVENVINFVREKQPVRVIDVAKILGKGEFIPTGFYLSTVWHLIATGKLQTNLDEELTNLTYVYLKKDAKRGLPCPL
ncbi:TnsA endonuclease N-terminal domain-containing protein [Phorcysia thermohydrogeniphila]|uniref:TnsA endonuclease-like protein n=1 Tax=Phorcysia thermohydrogeniphila TaxID=936138 RepID=A0A4R1G7U5_9BACT|nr:TnsA endonuclease N-terminal domain-containing protein [Phorcysia thermohydrogeniphila]TCK03844.1 TnsA endonuclease-like protein [Phorcysia thermohydrogeniphila]